MNISEDISTLFERNIPYFKRFALKLTKNQADADDLVQDAFIRAFNHFESFQNVGKFKSWFNTILYNTFINSFRKKNRRADLLSQELHTRGLFFNRKSTSNLGYERLKEADIRTCMCTLSEVNREAFSLYQAGYSYQEISNLQEIPLGTVKSRIYFVRNKMSKMLESAHLSNAA